MSLPRTINVPLVTGLLAERDWNWADLAAAMGVSKSSVSRISRYECGPSAEFVFALMSVFPQHREQLFVPAPEGSRRPDSLMVSTGLENPA